MSIVSNNIKYLRRLNGLTQEQFARRIGIKRSLLGAYEEARANPNLDNLMSIARAFNTTVDNLLKQDLRKIRETPDLTIPLDGPPLSGAALNRPGPLLPEVTEPEAPDDPQPLSAVLDQYYHIPPVQRPTPPEPFRRSESRPPAAINLVAQRVVPRPISVKEGRSPLPVQLTAASQPLVFNNVYENTPPRPAASRPTEPPVAERHNGDETHQPTSVQLVRRSDFEAYQQHHQQTGFLNSLPRFQLPMLPPGSYRAFEAGEEFVYEGALLIGQFVRNWFDVVDGKQFVVMIQNQGILFRRVFNQVKAKGTLLLTSDKPDVPGREVPIRDVQEIWEVKAFVSQQLPDPPPSLDRMRHLLDDMRFELERIQGKP